MHYYVLLLLYIIIHIRQHNSHCRDGKVKRCKIYKAYFIFMHSVLYPITFSLNKPSPNIKTNRIGSFSTKFLL